ncbi:MAG: L,D-transpeptidase [Candidatus Eisenbacteria bacterium]|nr:L,D-transpeptidase [Candidatus Eisenbacteria bacterium]
MSPARIVIRKSQFVLELIGPDGTRSYSVGIGSSADGRDKSEVGDCRTPEGEFEIASIEDSSEWVQDGERAYGPLFLRLHCPPWEGIGIHGTCDPDSVGHRSSRGCIRMRNEDLLSVAAEVSVGTRVRVLP